MMIYAGTGVQGDRLCFQRGVLRFRNAFGKLGWFWSGLELLCMRTGNVAHKHWNIWAYWASLTVYALCLYIRVHTIHSLSARLTPCSPGLCSPSCALSEVSSHQSRNLLRSEYHQVALLQWEAVGAYQPRIARRRSCLARCLRQGTVFQSQYILTSM